MKKFDNLLNKMSDKTDINRKIELLEKSHKYLHTDLPLSEHKKICQSLSDTV